MRPVRVDIVAYAPTVFRHCQHCEIAFHQLGVGSQVRHIEADESLPLDLQLEYLDLSDWARGLRDRHGAGVAIRVVDAASLLGVWMSWRHGVRSYPAVIVGARGKDKQVGADYRGFDGVIDRMVADAMQEGGTTT
ncbi:MAG: hypothetical protein ACRD2C_05545 [Acidimicrobiales bacterium]